MNHKKKIRILLIVAVAGIVLGAVIEEWLNATGLFLETFLFFSLVILIVLYFLPETIFGSWVKFVRVYLPISAILTLVSPSNRQCGLGVVCLGTDKEDVMLSLGVLFLMISLVLIVRAHRRLKRQAKVMPTPFPTGSQKSV